jgi:hypothetical protein
MESDLSCLLKNISVILFLLINLVKRKDLKQSFRFSHMNVAMNNLVIMRNTVTDTSTLIRTRFMIRTPDDGGGMPSGTYPTPIPTAGISLSWLFHSGVSFHRSRVDVSYAPLLLQRRCQVHFHWRNKLITLLISDNYKVYIG